MVRGAKFHPSENLFQIKATSCVENTLDPVWDNVIEFCTADYTKTVVSLVLHDKDVTALETLRIKDDPDDFMGSCNFYLTKVKAEDYESLEGMI